MIGEGDQAPAFEIPGVERGRRRTYRLSDLVADGGALLTFYPSDFSPRCTEQLCTLRNVEWFEFQPELSVVGLSQDTCHVHDEFIQRHDIPFPLLSDTDGRVTDAYGVRAAEWNGHPGVARRGFVLIDTDGVVQYRSVATHDTEVPDLDPVLEAARALDTPARA